MYFFFFKNAQNVFAMSLIYLYFTCTGFCRVSVNSCQMQVQHMESLSILYLFNSGLYNRGKTAKKMCPYPRTYRPECMMLYLNVAVKDKTM